MSGNVADRLAKGEEIDVEEYENIAKDRVTPVEVQIIRSVYGVKCDHCKTMDTVFETSIPEAGKSPILCLRCIDAIRSKQVPLDHIGGTYGQQSRHLILHSGGKDERVAAGCSDCCGRIYLFCIH